MKDNLHTHVCTPFHCLHTLTHCLHTSALSSVTRRTFSPLYMSIRA